jgi:hypothetical protein
MLRAVFFDIDRGNEHSLAVRAIAAAHRRRR